MSRTRKQPGADGGAVALPHDDEISVGVQRHRGASLGGRGVGVDELPTFYVRDNGMGIDPK